LKDKKGLTRGTHIDRQCRRYWRPVQYLGPLPEPGCLAGAAAGWGDGAGVVGSPTSLLNDREA